MDDTKFITVGPNFFRKKSKISIDPAGEKKFTGNFPKLWFCDDFWKYENCYPYNHIENHYAYGGRKF